MPRATDFSDEVAIQICTQIAEGEALVQICRAESMPAISTVYRWLAANEPFRHMYQLARDDQADTLADQIVAISDEAPYTVKKDEDGQDVRVAIVLDAAAVQRQRLRVDARKWVAAKLRPKKYGERQELVGAGGAPLIPHDPISEWSEQRRQLEGARRLAFILHRAGQLLDASAMSPDTDSMQPLQITHVRPDAISQPSAPEVPKSAGFELVDDDDDHWGSKAEQGLPAPRRSWQQE